MIRANIEINQNKLEEFIRVLLPEHYDIFSENSENDVEISVNFRKNQDVENFENNCGKLKDSESDNTEIITVNTSVNETTKAIIKLVFSSVTSLIKFNSAKTTDTIIPIENSFLITLKASFGEISPSARERITTVEDCEPTFPPLDISIGINAVKIMDFARTFS